MQEKHHAEYDVQRRARAGSSAVLRALVAGYLVYLAWQILRNVRSGETTMTPAVAYAASAFFLLAAAAFAPLADRGGECTAARSRGNGKQRG